MSFKKIATSATVAVAMLAAQIGPLAATASAGERHYGYSRHDGYRDYDSYRDYDRGSRREFRREHDRRDFRHGKRHAYGHNKHHYRKKDRTGRDIAIGLSALMIGAIIAAEASRSRGY